MNPSEAGMAALHMMSDLLDGLLAADTGLHHDGYAHGEEARVDYLLLDGFARPMMSRGIEGAARKYAGLPPTTGEAALVSPSYDHSPSEVA